MTPTPASTPSEDGTPTTPTPPDAIDGHDDPSVTAADGIATQDGVVLEETVLLEDDAVLDDAAPASAIAAPLVVRVGAELAGAFLVVLAGLGAALYSNLTTAWALGSLGLALTFGVTTLAALLAFGHLSGGLFNPALTLARAIAGDLSWRDVLPYWLAQLVGAILAAGVLFATVPATLPELLGVGNAADVFAGVANGYGETSLLATMTSGQAQFDLPAVLLLELVGTLLLAAVAVAVTRSAGTPAGADVDAHGGLHRAHVTGAVAVAAAYTALLLATTPVTSGALNPARATAAAVFSGSDALAQVWVFWVAPLVGAAVVGAAHLLLRTQARARA